ncbi:MAG: ABC transporter substrate-binding protein [Caldilineaceae bacterium]
MKRTTLHVTVLVAMLAVMLAACAQPQPIAPTQGSSAGDSSSQPAAGGNDATGEAKPGGIFVDANIADAKMLNPILSSETASQAVNAMLFPSLIGVDPDTGAVTPDGALAESWTVSDDGLIWTFKLRDGIKWSDGTPVTSADFKFTYDAVASDKVETPRKANLDGIKSIEAPDPLSVVVTYDSVRCDAIQNVGLQLLPSHLYKTDFSDIMTNTLNTEPTVSAGPLIFKSWTRDDNITMVRNDGYWEGKPYMDGRIIKIVPDTAAQLTQLENGEIDIMGLEPDQLTTAKGFDNVNIYNFKDDGYDFVGLNLADPNDPKAGRDENGKLIDQTPHPILGDKAVRQAIAHSLDYATIIDKVYLGQGYQLAANVLPAVDWAYDASLKPYDYNLETAKKLLEDGGWVDSDGDGVREKDGKPLELSLITNAGNKVREDLGALVQDQLKQVGIKVNFEAIDFGVVVDRLLGQKFDMVIIGWTGLGTDPNDDAFWSTQYDTPGSGFNFVSYHSDEMDKLLEQGKSVVGCKPEDRAPFYKQIQKLINDDVPYVFISGGVGNTAYAKRWANLDPKPWSTYYNIHQWYLKQ